MRIAKVTGRLPWHRHLNGDEGWLIWRGRLRIDVEGRDPIEVGPIPKGVYHSPT